MNCLYILNNIVFYMNLYFTFILTYKLLNFFRKYDNILSKILESFFGHIIKEWIILGTKNAKINN